MYSILLDVSKSSIDLFILINELNINIDNNIKALKLKFIRLLKKILPTHKVSQEFFFKALQIKA